MKVNSRYIKIVLLVCLVSSIFPTYTNVSSCDPTQDERKIFSTSEELFFTFNNTFQKKIFLLHFDYVELDRINKIDLLFMVNGTTSTQDGLNVTFIFDNSSTEFIIDTLFQDGTIHNLTETFTLFTSYAGNIDVYVICSGQSSSSVGFLTILETTIEKIDIPVLNEENSILPVYPDWLSFEGTINYWESRQVSTAFYNYNDTVLLNLSLSFTTNYFQSFDRVVYVSLNNKLVAEKSFTSNKTNSMEFMIDPDTGFNLLNVNFSVSVSYEIIKINDISLEGSLVGSFLEESVLDSFQWDGNEFTYSFDLSSLKPSKYFSDQVLYMIIDYQCLGMKIFPYLTYFLSSGSTILEEGQLDYSEQSHELNSLVIRTFTTEYHEELSFTIHGSATGTGEFIILHSSRIDAITILELEDNSLDILLSEEETANPQPMFYSLSYYSVFRTSTASSYVNLAINFVLSSTYEHPFDRLDVIVKINGTTQLTQEVDELGFANLSKSFELAQGYHEIKIIFGFYELNTPVTIQQLKYQATITQPPVEGDSSHTSTPPLSTSWMLAIYVCIFFWFFNKKTYRDKRKQRASSSSTEHSSERMQDKDVIFVLFLLQLLLYLRVMVLIHLYLSSIFHRGLQ